VTVTELHGLSFSERNTIMADANKNKGQPTQVNPGNQNQGNMGRGEAQGQGGALSGVAQMAKDAASSVSQTASEQARQAASSVAGGMHSLAGTIREHAPSQGMLGSAAGSVAEGLESGSRYLQREGFAGMADDLAGVVRRNPIPSMLVCLGLGFFLGRVLSSSSPSPRSY
jgi:hypothetical protein